LPVFRLNFVTTKKPGGGYEVGKACV
jgi:hypothetical protein